MHRSDSAHWAYDADTTREGLKPSMLEELSRTGIPADYLNALWMTYRVRMSTKIAELRMAEVPIDLPCVLRDVLSERLHESPGLKIPDYFEYHSEPRSSYQTPLPRQLLENDQSRDTIVALNSHIAVMNHEIACLERDKTFNPDRFLSASKAAVSLIYWKENTEPF